MRNISQRFGQFLTIHFMRFKLIFGVRQIDFRFQILYLLRESTGDDLEAASEIGGQLTNQLINLVQGDKCAMTRSTALEILEVLSEKSVKIEAIDIGNEEEDIWTPVELAIRARLVTSDCSLSDVS